MLLLATSNPDFTGAKRWRKLGSHGLLYSGKGESGIQIMTFCDVLNLPKANLTRITSLKIKTDQFLLQTIAYTVSLDYSRAN